jgi:hypothetical protein
MSIRVERSDTGLSQSEVIIDFRQELSLFLDGFGQGSSVSSFALYLSALTEGSPYGDWT